MTMCVCTSDELNIVTLLKGNAARRGSRGISIGDLLSSYGHLIGLAGFGGLALLTGYEAVPRPPRSAACFPAARGGRASRILRANSASRSCQAASCSAPATPSSAPAADTP